MDNHARGEYPPQVRQILREFAVPDVRVGFGVASQKRLPLVDGQGVDPAGDPLLAGSVVEIEGDEELRKGY